MDADDTFIYIDVNFIEKLGRVFDEKVTYNTRG